MTPLLTATDYKDIKRIDGTEQDDAIAMALDAASDVVTRYTERSFGDTPAAGTRTYWYDGSGTLEIADCALITAVTVNGVTLTPNIDYIAQPTNEPVFTWLDLEGVAAGSPAMGFMNNLDTIAARSPGGRVQVTVAASFGWATVPGSVKQAVIWLADEFLEDSSMGLQAESIADLSKVYAAGLTSSSDVLPPRITQLLDPFRRWSV